MDKPLVSIITINYNQSSVTMDLLRTIRGLSYPNVEVIVVDNASPNDRPEIIKERYPEVKLIKSETNLGFAGGNNLGVMEAKGDYLLFINNDTEVPRHFIEPLLETLEYHPDIGMVSPKIKFHWNPELIQYAGFTAMNPYTIRNSAIGYHQKDDGRYDAAGDTDSIHGAAMMVPRRIVEEVGTMTEQYFLYYEEHDWAQQVKRAGYRLYYQPASYILHKESIATGKNSPLKTYYLTRNRILYARRNFNRWQLAVSLTFQCLVSAPKNLLRLLILKDYRNLKAYWRGLIWNLSPH